MSPQNAQTTLEMIRQGLQGIVEAIPHAPTVETLSTTVAGRPRMAQKRRAVARRSQRPYRPRVVYSVKRAAPKRHPLPETETQVYRAIKRHPKATAKWLFDTLQLREGQLWGALKRLIDAGYLRSIDAR